MSDPLQRDERDFFRVIKFATALAMGGMAAFLYSLKQVHPDIVFRLTLGTAVIFVVTAVFSWVFCGVLAKGEQDAPTPTARKRFILRWMVTFLGLATLGMLVSFALSLRNVTSAGRREVIEGTVIAIGVLAMGGFLIWKAFRFFEEQSEAELARLREEHAEDSDDP